MHVGKATQGEESTRKIKGWWQL